MRYLLKKKSFRDLLDKCSSDLGPDSCESDKNSSNNGKRSTYKKRNSKKSGLYRKASDKVKVPQLWSHVFLK